MLRTPSTLGAAVILFAASYLAGGLKTPLFSRDHVGDDDAQRTLTTLDTNHDGFVDRNEIAAFAISQGLDSAAATADFSTLDMDGDGLLDASELAGALGNDAESAAPLAPVPASAASAAPPGGRQAQAKGSAKPTEQQNNAKRMSHAAEPKQRAHTEQVEPPYEAPATHSKQSDAEDKNIEAELTRLHEQTTKTASSDRNVQTAMLATRMSQELVLQEKIESMAHSLDVKADDLRHNLTAATQSAAERARRAALDAANRKSNELLGTLAKLEQGAQKAEVAAAALRAKTKAQLEQADEFMVMAHAALGGN